MTIPAKVLLGAELLQPSTLRRVIGSYWSELYEDKAAMAALIGVSQQAARQLYRGMREHLDATHPRLTPLLSTETFRLVHVRVADVSIEPLRYGNTAVYGSIDQPFVYGDFVYGGWNVPLDDTIRDAAGVANGTVRPTAFFSAGRDCVFSFNDAGTSVRIFPNPADVFKSVIRGGEQYYEVWVYMAGADNQSLAKQHGRTYGLTGQSDDYLRQAIVACREASQQAPTELQLRRVLAAAVREQVVEGDQTVRYVLNDYGRPVVILDHQRIVGDYGKVPICSVGDRLRSGDFVFDTVKLVTFEHGVPSWLNGVWFPSRLTGLDQGYWLPAGQLELFESNPGSTLVPDADLVSPDLSGWLASGSDHIRKSLQLTDPNNAVPGKSADVLASLATTTLRYSTALVVIRVEFFDEAAEAMLRQVKHVLPVNVALIFQTADDELLE